MPKNPATVDDDREPVADVSIDIVGGVDDAHITAYYQLDKNSLLGNLITSGVAAVTDGNIIWRTGHLEHIANLYAGDPATTERNYADDLAVARAYSPETWEKLTNGR